MDDYKQSEELKSLAQKVIDGNPDIEHLKDERLRIAFLMSNNDKKSRGKTVFADTTKIGDKVKALCGYDFVVTFYQKACSGLDEEQMQTLMYHELRHIGWKDGKCSIIPHDIEDFKSILEKHGLDWTIYPDKN